MMANDYSRSGNRQLEVLLGQAKRSEQDFQRRLDARLDRPALVDAHGSSNPDPVAKRLRFLLAKFRHERRAVERELAARSPRSDRALRGIAGLDPTQVAGGRRKN